MPNYRKKDNMDLFLTPLAKTSLFLIHELFTENYTKQARSQDFLKGGYVDV